MTVPSLQPDADLDLGRLDGLLDGTSMVDLGLLDGTSMVNELGRLHTELDLAMQQRELLQSIRAKIDELPISEQGDMLSSMMTIFKEEQTPEAKEQAKLQAEIRCHDETIGDLRAEQRQLAEQVAEARRGLGDQILADQTEGMETREDAEERFQEFSALSEDDREKDFAMDLMDILVRPQLSEEEQETLRPMARHVLQKARHHVSTAIVIEKIPALLDDVLAGDLALTPSEMLACALATPVLGLEFAKRPALVGRLEPIELMTLLCKCSDPMVAEAVATEAPQLGQLGAEHVALLQDENPTIATHLLGNPWIHKRLSAAIEELPPREAWVRDSA